MVLTGPFLIAFLVYVFFYFRKKKTPSAPPPTQAKALLINSRTGGIDQISIPADWEAYAKAIGSDQTTIGARGTGYVVFIDQRANSFLNLNPQGGFRILGARGQDFKGSGLVIPVGSGPVGLQVEIFVLGESTSYIHQIGT